MISEVTQTGSVIQVRAKTLDVNAYIIEKHDHIIIIDSLLLPQDSRELNDIAQKLNKPLKYLINTHFHSDHCLGNRFLKQDCTTQINHYDYWTTITNEKAMINPRKYKPVDQLRLTKPEITIKSEYRIDDIILFPSPGHSNDSICIYLPDEKALIAGDTILNNATGKYSLPYFFWGNAADLIKSLKHICTLDIKTIYSGHGLPLDGTDKILSDMNYLQNLITEVDKLREQQLTSHQLAEQITISSGLNSYQLPAVPQVHELNIRQLKSKY